MAVINVFGGIISAEERAAYFQYVQDKFPGREIARVDVKLDGEYVDLSWELVPKKFERIRRITGYLVGTLDRFNDAKHAEVLDRVKHGIGSGFETI